MLDDRLLTIRKEAGAYQVNTWFVRSEWRDSLASRESLHALLTSAGYRRIRPHEDGDPLTGDYRRYAH